MTAFVLGALLLALVAALFLVVPLLRRAPQSRSAPLWGRPMRNASISRRVASAFCAASILRRGCWPQGRMAVTSWLLQAAAHRRTPEI